MFRSFLRNKTIKSSMLIVFSRTESLSLSFRDLYLWSAAFALPFDVNNNFHENISQVWAKNVCISIALITWFAIWYAELWRARNPNNSFYISDYASITIVSLEFCDIVDDQMESIKRKYSFIAIFHVISIRIGFRRCIQFSEHNRYKID